MAEPVKINENKSIEIIPTPPKPKSSQILCKYRMTEQNDFCKFVGFDWILAIFSVRSKGLDSAELCWAQSRINGCHPVSRFSTCKEVDTLLYVKPPKNLINVTVELLFTKQCMLWTVPKHFRVKTGIFVQKLFSVSSTIYKGQSIYNHF